MPGLLGIISLNGVPLSPHLLAQMRAPLLHRPWYRTDDYCSADKRLAVGRVHLGVFNPEPQPLVQRAGRVHVWAYGELYSDQSAPRNASDGVWQQYEQAGPDGLTRLKGSFMALVADADAQAVWLVNDRIGSKPLYYYQDATAFYFAPEQKSLLALPTLPRQLYAPAVADFLTNGQFTAPHTLISGVHLLDSATLLQFNLDGQITARRYWMFTFDEEARDRGVAHYQEELSTHLRQAVHRTLHMTDRCGVLLSGGYDSRAILGCCLEERPAVALNTVSWGREEMLPQSDCAVARQLSEQLGVPHSFYALSGQEIFDDFQTFIWMGEGLTDFPESYTVFDRIRERQGLAAVLRGDECFGYSHWMTVHDELSMFRALDLRMLRYMPDMANLLYPAIYREFCEMDAATRQQLMARCTAHRLHNRKDFFYLNARVKYYLNPLNYVKTFAVEAPRPLLDDDMLEFMTRLPLKYRLGKRFWRATVVQLFPRLYTEMAQRHNMILWPAALRAPGGQEFVRASLLTQPSILDEWVDRPAMQTEVERFLAPRSTGSVQMAWLTRLERYPHLYAAVHAGNYQLKKWRGRVEHTLEPERIVLRLLILKGWAEVVLGKSV